jgi:hypothetical protein
MWFQLYKPGHSYYHIRWWHICQHLPTHIEHVVSCGITHFRPRIGFKRELTGNCHVWLVIYSGLLWVCYVKWINWSWWIQKCTFIHFYGFISQVSCIKHSLVSAVCFSLLNSHRDLWNPIKYELFRRLSTLSPAFEIIFQFLVVINCLITF